VLHFFNLLGAEICGELHLVSAIYKSSAAGAVYVSSAYDSEVHFAKSPSMIQDLP
jgi:hypothetical protein